MVQNEPAYIQLGVKPAFTLSSEEDLNSGESGPFLTHHPEESTIINSHGKRSWHYRVLCLLLIIVSVALVVETIVFSVAAKNKSGKNASALLAPSSSVKKVTGVYGDGVWLDSTVAHNITRSRLERAIFVHQKHAQKHHHEQVVLRRDLFGSRVNNAYTKIGNLLEHNLIEMAKGEGKGASWLFWHDADTVVLNSLIPLDIFVNNITGLEAVNMLYTSDFNGLNGGVFFLRIGEWASLFLAHVLAMAQPIGMPLWEFWEQGAIKKTLEEVDYFGKAAVEVPKGWFNRYGDLTFDNTTNTTIDFIEPGTFMVHLAGPDKYKEGWFDYYLEMAEGGVNPRYHNGTAVALIRKQVEKFWEGRLVNE